MRALALFSGGLDSQLACKLIATQGIDVVGLHFDFGYLKDEKKDFLYKSAKDVNIDLEIIDIQSGYEKEVLFSPKHGYGKGFNPCIDCHAYMFKMAFDMLEKYEASFLISGEVLGERPMSQNARALDLIKNSFSGGELIVRPLSAKLLAPSLPEERGWVDRQKLLDIQGRNRKKQLSLANEFGLKDFETPAGGCLLTEKFFKTKMVDLLNHGGYTSEDAKILPYGRHFRLPNSKLIVSRNQEENEIFLRHEKISSKYSLIRQISKLGSPLCFVSKNPPAKDVKIAIKIISSYIKNPERLELVFTLDNEEFRLNEDIPRSFGEQYLLRG